MSAYNKECAVCHRSYCIPPSRLATSKYCSNACQIVARKGRRPHNIGNRGGENRACQICGQTYYASPARIKHDSKYCSRTCFAESKRRLTGPEHPLYRKQDVACFNCGKAIKRIPALLALYQHPFCSRRCVGIYSKAHQPNPSMIESIVADELSRRNIPFIPQFRYELGVADFFVSPNIIIECDGDYWHRLDSVRERDARKDEYFSEHGFKLFRFREREIRADVIACVARLTP